MYERFTEHAHQVVARAQEEARTLKHNYIGTEHILLGLLRVEDGLAFRVLKSVDITVERVRAQVVRIVGSADDVYEQIPLTPRTKKVFELALREALSLGHNFIGTEHILLGLVRENEGVAARILWDFNHSSDSYVWKIRNKVHWHFDMPARRLPASLEQNQSPLAWLVSCYPDWVVIDWSRWGLGIDELVSHSVFRERFLKMDFRHVSEVT